MGDDQADHDQLFKSLLTTFFFEFVQLFFPEMAAYLDRNVPPEFLDKELFTDLIAGERRAVDLAAKVRFKDEDGFFLIHVENQGTPQARFHRRMFHYFSILDRNYDLPVYPIAIFSYDAPQRPEQDSYVVKFPDCTVLQFSFRVIQLNRLNWRDFLRKPNPVAAALMTKMKIAPEDRPKVTLECLRMIANLRLDPARSALIGEFMNRYLALSQAETKVYNEAYVVLTPSEQESVMQIENGIAARVVHRSLEKTVLRLLQHRFGQVPTEIPNRLKELSEEKLEALTTATLDFATLADLEAWMTANT